uniref:Alpha-aminoacylpeptide hydrolase n=1 Tax=Kalanchoe fedtschenkoi TaxID=63787 RepID=A0A7N1A587_KALFE
MDQFCGQARLPKFAVPIRYDLDLKPDLDACTFSGSVRIDLDIVSDTSFIVLNAADLTIAPASVLFTTVHKVLEPRDVQLMEDDEILVLGFSDNLPIGRGVLSIDFEGCLDDDLKGFYRSEYEVNGETRIMAVTQFEPADARRCFPCWDEPAFKATFKITLDVPSDLTALSNMPIVQEMSSGHLKTISYQESPIMSTYLVAIVTGLFDFVEDHTSDGTRVRVYCPVGKADQGKFALGVAVKTLGLYKEYFGVPYSLPKLDMVAIPDFAAGAMENYGLVTYRDTELLFDENHSAASNKQNVSISVTHELAHQWFGNLVTMEWWTDLWLNEGFATWIPIHNTSEIEGIFDGITYDKGAAVLRMLQTYLGPRVFQVSGKNAFVQVYNLRPQGRETAWLWLQDNWDSILKIFDDGLFALFCPDSLSQFASVEKASEVRAFFASRTLPSFADMLEESIQQILKNSRWVHNIQKEKNLAEVVQQLSQGNC